jgi:hypothetical protein
MIGDDSEDRLAYCRHELQPLWERWTDGNLSLRRALECGRTILMTAITTLMVRGEAWGATAAIRAGWACMFALEGVPADVFGAACERAIGAHLTAEGGRGNGQG